MYNVLVNHNDSQDDNLVSNTENKNVKNYLQYYI